jgi:hypothetical protein
LKARSAELKLERRGDFDHDGLLDQFTEGLSFSDPS